VKKLVCIKENLSTESPLRRYLASRVNVWGLRWGRKIGLKLYSASELKGLLSQSKFSASSSIEPITLQNLPIFVRIKMEKPLNSGQK